MLHVSAPCKGIYVLWFKPVHGKHCADISSIMPKKKKAKRRDGTVVRLWCMGVVCQNHDTHTEVQGIAFVKIRRPAHLPEDDETTSREMLSPVTTVHLPVSMNMAQPPHEQDTKQMHQKVKAHVMGMTEDQRMTMQFMEEAIDWNKVDW